MKAIAIREFGRPEGMAVVDLPTPVPAAGQVLIATEAIGVGGVDALIRSGALAAYALFEEGHVPGSEVAGAVTAVGAGVDASWVGRRVWAFTGMGGGYVEQAIAPVDAVLPLPAELSAADAVTLGTSGVVAHFALRHAHFAPGDSVLVRGAAGSLGIPTVQLAARGGASAVAVTTSSAERGERLRKLGATHVLDRTGTPTEGDTPEGYDVVIDIIAGPDMPAFLDLLNPNGRLVAIGMVAGPPPADLAAHMTAAFRKSMSFATFSADTVPEAAQRAVRTELFAGELALDPVVHAVLPLDEAVRAHQLMASGEAFGRIVLVP
ncbi:zinc-dependent alcohol dehydrogenase family protein [Streptomyces sp. NPDC059897]|uniref:zinc-dependent alcohol dehydrogenase family protein n=1 Tax=Streptomyces sp. NPDC059897 TaxID=3346994 RepID=UPI0036561550